MQSSRAFRGILSATALALVLVAAVACSSEAPSGSQSRPLADNAAPANAGVAPAGSTDASPEVRLDEELATAIRTAQASMSPDALDAHIRRVTKAKYSMIVAPYDPRAEAETEEFGRTWIAGSGTDAGLTTAFQGFIHDSGGHPFRYVDPRSETGAPLLYAGQPLRVAGQAGYVLVARPPE